MGGQGLPRNNLNDVRPGSADRTDWVTEAKILAHESGGVYDCLGRQISNYFHMKSHLTQLARVLINGKPIVNSWNFLIGYWKSSGLRLR